MSSIARQIGVVSSQIENATRTNEFAMSARCLLAAKGLPEAAEFARGVRATERVQSLLKSAVAAGTTTDLADLVPFQQVADAFLQTVASASVFEALRANGDWRILPANTRVGAASPAALGYPHAAYVAAALEAYGDFARAR
jgi:hypothetical protein